MSNFPASDKIKKFLIFIGEYNKFYELFSKDFPLEDKFAEFWDRDDIRRSLKINDAQEIINRKDATVSHKFRKEGNRLYLKNKLDKAIEAYNYALIFAPLPEKGDNNDGQNNDDASNMDEEDSALSLAYSNRSAIAYELRKYEQCIQDIDRAFHYGYSSKKRMKLEERKGRCYLRLGKAQRALESFTSELDMARSINDEAKIKNATKYIRQCERGGEDEGEVNVLIKDMAKRGPEKPVFMRFKNSDIDNAELNFASNAIDVKYSPNRGRHLVATRNIKPGEVIMVEKAFAATTLVGNKMRSYCYLCKRKSLFCLPCANCALVVYCSDECKTSPDNNHSLECPVLPLLILSQPDPEVLLVFRTLMKFRVSQIFSELDDDINYHQKGTNLITSDFRRLLRFDRKYSALGRLEGNIDKRTGTCFIEAAANGVSLVEIMQMIPEFWQNKEKNKTISQNRKNLIRLGGEIMNLILSFQCNIHCIKELAVDPTIDILSCKSFEVGYGIYTGFSLVNHSCAPNVLHSSWGEVKYMYAIHRIQKGEEIVDTYGERYSSHDLKTRRENLFKTYFFQCDCKACEDKWPMFPNIPFNIVFKCKFCEKPLEGSEQRCSQCLYSLRVGGSRSMDYDEPCPVAFDTNEIQQEGDKFEQEYKHAVKNLKFRRDETSFEDVKKISGYINYHDIYATMPSRSVVLAQEALLRTFDLMGSYYIIPCSFFDDL